MQFPSVSGKNLEGDRFDLPGDLDLPALVVVAFRQYQQPLVDTWLELVDSLAEREVATYELPTIRSMDPLRQWATDRGMRAGIADRAARERTITVYTDLPTFRRSLDLPGYDVTALLLDADGEVVWRADGSRDGHDAAKIVDALRTRSARA